MESGGNDGEVSDDGQVCAETPVSHFNVFDEGGNFWFAVRADTRSQLFQQIKENVMKQIIVLMNERQHETSENKIHQTIQPTHTL